MPEPGPIVLLIFVLWRPESDPTSYMKYGKVAVMEQGNECAWQLFAGPAIHDLDAFYGFDDS